MAARTSTDKALYGVPYSLRGTGDLIEVAADFPVFGCQLPDSRQAVHRLTGDTVTMGRMVALVMACRINSAWLMSQFFSRSVKSAYSSSVMRVLTTRLRWGVLYRFPMGINSFHLSSFSGQFCKVFFQRRMPHSRVWGRHSPTRFTKGAKPQICGFWHRGRILL